MHDDASGLDQRIPDARLRGRRQLLMAVDARQRRRAGAMLKFASVHVSMPRNQGENPCPGWTPTASASTIELAGHGPSVVLLHEMGGTLDSWDGIFPALSKRFRTLRYDQRGSGLSEKVRQPITTEILVDDLEAVLQASGLPPPYHFVTRRRRHHAGADLHDQASRSRCELRVLQSVHRRRSEPGGRARTSAPDLAEREGLRKAIPTTLDKSWPPDIGDRAAYATYRGRYLAHDPVCFAAHQPVDRAAQRDASRQGHPQAHHGGGRPLRQGAAARHQRAVREDDSRRTLRADRRRAYDAGAGAGPLLALLEDFLPAQTASAAQQRAS